MSQHSQRPTPSARQQWLAIGLMAVGGLLVLVPLLMTVATTPKRFAPVSANRLYRSGELTPSQLAAQVNRHGIRTVLSMLDPAVPESLAEREAAERLGVRWLNVPLRGNGESTAEERDRIRQILLDDAQGPLLVHCAAGVNRTGLAVGMWRIHREGWTYERVLEEMRRFDFEDGPNHQELRDALRAEAELRDAQRRTEATGETAAR